LNVRKYAQRYLAEAGLRFNYRFRMTEMLPMCSYTAMLKNRGQIPLFVCRERMRIGPIWLVANGQVVSGSAAQIGHSGPLRLVRVR
jgi:hypothetical protein